MVNNSKLSFSPVSTYKKNDFSEESFIEQATNSIYRIVTTPVGSDFENPLYGCNIRSYLFSHATENTLVSIKESVQNALDDFEPLFSSSINIDVTWWQEKIVGARKYIQIDFSFDGIKGTLLSLLVNLTSAEIKKIK